MNRFLVPLGSFAALAVSVTLWWFMPELIGEEYGHQMKQAGWLVPALIMLLILQIAFVVERMLSLHKAQGRGSLPDFLNNVRKKLHAVDVDGAIQLCGQQRGSAANVMRAGLDRYNLLRKEHAPKEKIVAETQAAIQEASGLEGALPDSDGWVILINVDHTVNTSIHYAERLTGRRTFTRWALLRDRVMECPNFPGDSSGFNAIASHLRSETRRVELGEALIQAVPLNRLFEVVHQLIKKDPLALLCHRIDCERCNAVRNT